VKHYVFPYFGKLKIERDSKFGGDVEYESLDSLLQDFKEMKLHPMDLKRAVAKYLNELIDDARKELTKIEPS
jgi:tyrosyl-tRNA synthetase